LSIFEANTTQFFRKIERSAFDSNLNQNALAEAKTGENAAPAPFHGHRPGCGDDRRATDRSPFETNSTANHKPIPANAGSAGSIEPGP
jgi:hypothetical protein